MSQNYLKKLRKKHNIGQTELAQLAGVSKQLIWGFENGKNGVSPQVLRKLAEILKVSPKEITEGVEEKKFNDSDKEILTNAINSVNDYYKDYSFDQDMMTKITTELYGFMSEYNATPIEEADHSDIDKSLNEKIASGLAAKCFLNIKKSSQ